MVFICAVKVEYFRMVMSQKIAENYVFKIVANKGKRKPYFTVKYGSARGRIKLYCSRSCHL